MTRPAVATLLLLSACVPTISDGNTVPELALLYESGVLELHAPAPVVYLRLRLHGNVKSRYCLEKGCKLDPDGWVYLSLPSEKGPYPPPLPLATGAVQNVEALLHLEGERETRRLSWPPP